MRGKEFSTAHQQHRFISIGGKWAAAGRTLEYSPRLVGMIEPPQTVGMIESRVGDRGMIESRVGDRSSSLGIPGQLSELTRSYESWIGD